jgi:hypothetical protein
MYLMAVQSINNSGNGNQFSTGTPQSGDPINLSTSNAGSQLQSNISTSSLQSNTGDGANGISLNSLIPISNSTTTPKSQTSSHHVNGPLLGVAAFLLIAAVILAWLASKYNHGEYNN